MPLEGKLDYSDIADLLKTVDVRKKSGVMLIRCEERLARMYFIDGELVFAKSDRFTDHIGDILVGRGVIEREQVERALQIQQQEEGQRRIGMILNEDMGVGDRDIQKALADQYKAIVFDVLSWPGGNFEFDVERPEADSDKFTLNASDFILQVGLETGMLADQATQQSNGFDLAVVDSDVGFSGKCGSFLSDNVTYIATPQGLESAAPALRKAGRLVLLVSVADYALGADAAATARVKNPDATVIAYGEAGFQWRDTRLAKFADGFVAKPSARELEGEAGRRPFEVFMRLLQGAVHTALRER